MDNQLGEFKWQKDQDISTGHGDSFRCLPGGLGGQLQVGEYWGSMESGRTVNAGAWLATEAFTQGRTSLNILLCLDKRLVVAYINHKGGTHSNSLPLLAVGFEQRDCPESQTSTRYQECASRSNVEGISGSHGLEVVSHSIQ